MTDGLLINPYRYATTAGKSVTYLQHAGDETDLTTYTFSSQNLGTADAGRYIICGIAGRGGGSTVLTISSVTIGGVAATQVVQAENSPTNVGAAGIFVANVPTGTSGDVEVTFSRGIFRASIDLWSASGITTTAHDSDSSTADPGTATLDTLAGGFLVALTVASGASSPTYTWTNATERYDGSLAATSVATVGAADASTSGSSVAVTADGSVATVEPVTVFASW